MNNYEPCFECDKNNSCHLTPPQSNLEGCTKLKVTADFKNLEKTIYDALKTGLDEIFKEEITPVRNLTEEVKKHFDKVLMRLKILDIVTAEPFLSRWKAPDQTDEEFRVEITEMLESADESEFPASFSTNWHMMKAEGETDADYKKRVKACMESKYGDQS